MSEKIYFNCGRDLIKGVKGCTTNSQCTLKILFYLKDSLFLYNHITLFLMILNKILSKGERMYVFGWCPVSVRGNWKQFLNIRKCYDTTTARKGSSQVHMYYFLKNIHYCDILKSLNI